MPASGLMYAVSLTVTGYKTAFNHLDDTKNRTERNETKFFLQHCGARTQDLSSYENIPGGKRTCWEVDLFPRTISSQSRPENEATSLYWSVEICRLGPHPPSASQDSAPLPPGVTALPASLSANQSLAQACPHSFPADLHCHLIANQLVTSLTLAASPRGKPVSSRIEFCPDMHTEMAGTFHLMVYVKFLFTGSDGMRFCSSLVSFPRFQIPGPVNWIPAFISSQLPTLPLLLASEVISPRMKSIFSRGLSMPAFFRRETQYIHRPMAAQLKASTMPSHMPEG